MVLDALERVPEMIDTPLIQKCLYLYYIQNDIQREPSGIVCRRVF